jgi:HK97 family phage major capsid protein
MSFTDQQTISRIRNLVDSLDSSCDEEPQSCGGFLDLPKRDVEKYSLLRAIDAKLSSIRSVAGRMGGGIPFGGLEGESDETLQTRLGRHVHGGRIYVPAEILYRDLTVASASGGGFLVGTANGSFIDTLRNRSIVFTLGAQRVSGLRENLALPKQNTSPSLTWLTTEAAQSPESQQTFTQVSGTPKTLSAYTEISDKLLKQSNAEPIVTRGLASDLAVGVDAAALNGSGASGQPLGIIGTAGIGGVTGTSIAYAGLVEAQVDIADNSAVLNPNALGYVTTPLMAQLLKGRQRFTGTDSPLWKGAIHQGEIEGLRAFSTKQMPASTLLYGDWSSLLVAEWGVLTIELDPFTSFQKGIVGVRSLWSIDILVQQPLSFTLCASIT